MDHIFDKKIISSQLLKSICYDLVTQETEDCRSKISIEFEWMPSKRIGTIKCENRNQLNVKINLYAVKGTYFNICYSASFIANYILSIDESFNQIPDSYFQGLVYLNHIYDLKREHEIDLFVPAILESKHVGKNFRFTSCELKCAIRAFKHAKEICKGSLSQTERDNIDKKLCELTLLSSIPEVAYVGTNLPVHSMFDVLQKLCEQKVLMEQMNITTITDLFHAYMKTGNQLYGGIALRLFAYSESQYLDEVIKDEVVRLGFEKMANEYLKQGVEYIQKYEGFKSKVLRDNLIVVENTAKKINKKMNRYGLNYDSGTIHPLINL